MRVEQILARKGDEVATIPPDSLVADALRELGRRGIGALVVSSDGLRVEGIVSERDVVRQLNARGPTVVGRTVAEVMTSGVATCSLEAGVDDLMAMMTQMRVRHVPVVEAGQLVGIVSIGDVVKARIDELEAEARLLGEYIGAR